MGLSAYCVIIARSVLVKVVVADLPTKHVKDHGALLQRHGLELGRKRIQASGRGERNGVVGQCAGGDVDDRCLQCRLPGYSSSTYISSP